MTQHMRAWQFDGPGAMEQHLHLRDDVPQPSADSLKKGQVLVKVASASLNPADYKAPGMGVSSRAMLPYPKTVGMDLSGHVVSVASDVTAESAKPGDVVIVRVNPMQAPGSLSEYVVAGPDEWAKVPKDADLDQLAGAPTAALTAYQVLKTRAGSGDKVFINGGAGGTGTFGIQIAKTLGCHVTTSCSTAKMALCRDLGADEVIDYKTTNVTEELKKQGQVFKLVIDYVGGSPADLPRECDKYLRPDGGYVLIGGGANIIGDLVRGLFLPKFLGGYKRKFEFIFTKNDKGDLAQVAEWLVTGKIKTVVDSTFEFDQTMDAYRQLKTGSSTGKVIVHVAK